MRAYIIALALAASLIPAPARAICTTLSTGMKLDLPNFGDPGNVWAQCLRDNFEVINDSAAISLPTSTATFHTVKVGTITALDGNSEIVISTTIRAALGSASIPSYSFVDDPDTGMFMTGADNTLRFATGGISRMEVISNRVFFLLQLAPQAASESAPAYSFNGDLDTGMFRDPTMFDDLGFATAGLERFRIDDIGRMGIGTKTPATKLDVEGSAQFGSGATKSTFTTNGSLNLANGADFSGVDAIDTADIQDAAVTTPKLNADAVTTAKIIDGAVTTPKLSTDSVTVPKIAAGAVTTPKLGSGSVTSPKLFDGAVTTPKLASGSVASDTILDSAVTTPKLNADSVTTDKIINAAITTPKLNTDAVTTVKLINEAVTTPKIADDAVTKAKIAQDGCIDGQILKLSGTTWECATDDTVGVSIGEIVQSTMTIDCAAKAITTPIPFDNTLPESTEGDPLADVTITPNSASNILRIKAMVVMDMGGPAQGIATIFKDSDASATFVGWTEVDGANPGTTIHILNEVSAGSTSAQTWKLRAGPTSATLHVNRSNGSATIFGGGVTCSSILVEEIKQ